MPQRFEYISGNRPARQSEEAVMGNIVPAQDIINESKKRGYLAKQLYVVFTRPSNGLDPVMENLVSHLEYQQQLEQDGIMFAAGPNWTDDEQGWEGDGMVVIRAASMAEARDIASRDPMHTSGARTFQIRPWLVNEGSLTIQLEFASGRFKLG
jgi:uncharacterized protein